MLKHPKESQVYLYNVDLIPDFNFFAEKDGISYLIQRFIDVEKDLSKQAKESLKKCLEHFNSEHKIVLSVDYADYSFTFKNESTGIFGGIIYDKKNESYSVHT